MASTIVHHPRDPNTLSNYNSFLTIHTQANFSIDFEKNCLSGNVVLTLKSITDAASKEILLDTSYLTVKEVEVDGKAHQWELLSRSEPYGSVLKISLESGVGYGEKTAVNVGQLCSRSYFEHYVDCIGQISTQTTKECTALGWMTPTQARSRHPYMCQSSPLWL